MRRQVGLTKRSQACAEVMLVEGDGSLGHEVEKEENMKITKRGLAVLGAAIVAWPIGVLAGEFKTPIAPEEFQKWRTRSRPMPKS